MVHVKLIVALTISVLNVSAVPVKEDASKETKEHELEEAFTLEKLQEVVQFPIKKIKNAALDPDGKVKVINLKTMNQSSNTGDGMMREFNALSTLFFCTFDDLCSYMGNSVKNKARYTWIISSGSTSDETGPSTDLTYGSVTGDYLYAEASGAQYLDTAVLVTKSYTVPSEVICLEWGYHMYGADIGGLGVLIYSVSDKTAQRVWFKALDQGNAWRRVALTVTSVDVKFQVMFVAVRGDGYKSDIALDDIRLSSGECE